MNTNKIPYSLNIKRNSWILEVKAWRWLISLARVRRFTHLAECTTTEKAIRVTQSWRSSIRTLCLRAPGGTKTTRRRESGRRAEHTHRREETNHI